MSWIINYFVLGILVMWVLSSISRKVHPEATEYHFTEWEKIGLIIGWPVYLTTFIVMFIATFIKK